MKIVDRKTFLALPAGTLFAKFGTPCTYDIGSLAIKDETWNNDFLYQDLVGDFVEANDDNEHRRLLDDMVAGKEARPDFDCLGRDGYFTENQLFLVYDDADKNGLINRLSGAGPAGLAERQKRFHRMFMMIVMAIRANGGEIIIGPSAAIDGFPDNLMIVERRHPKTDSIILTLGTREVD